MRPVREGNICLMELARNKDDGETQRTIVEQMKTRFPESPWLAEALYSSGNMYLLRKDFPERDQILRRARDGDFRNRASRPIPGRVRTIRPAATGALPG